MQEQGLTRSQLDMPCRKPVDLFDRAIFRSSGVESACFIGYAATLYLVPLGVLCVISVGSMSWAELAGAPLLVMLSGYGLFIIATTGHEGFHFNLARKPLLSCYLGCLFSALLPMFCAAGFFLFHWHHHRRVNSVDDPDFIHFSRYRGLWGRFALARLVITAGYLMKTVDVAWHGVGDEGALPLAHAEFRRLAWFNLLCQTIWLAAYLAVGFVVPHFLLAFGSVLCATTVISSINAFQEHAFAGPQIEPVARSRTARIVTLLHAGSNFHVEHHLYPAVPCWRLPRVHRSLVQHGWYARQSHLLDGRFFGTFEYCLSKHRYGGQQPMRNS